MKLTVEQRLQRAFVQITRSPEYCLVSGVMLCGKSSVSDSVPTAQTDGWNVQYGRKFMAKLNEKEFTAVVLHETYHKAFRQLTVWKAIHKENHRLANRAADYVINIMIDDADPNHRVAHLPEGALLDAQYRGMNTKEVFEILKKKQGRKPKDGEEGEPLDDHEWGEEGKEGGEGNKEGEEGKEGGEGKEGVDRDRAIDNALRQGKVLQKRIGNGKGGGTTALDELLAPTVNWRDQLREFVTSIANGKDLSTWRRPSRRGMARDVYLPATYSETVGEIVVAIDTSGSIGGEELRSMVSEMVGICEQVMPDKVHLIWWGSSVVGEQVFEPGQYEGMARSLRPKDGGGTDLHCVFDWVIERRVTPACVVVLTDGCWDTPPAPPYPVLFGMTTDTVSPFGTTIRIKD